VGRSFEVVVTGKTSSQDRVELDMRLDEFNRERTGFRDDRDLSCFLRHDDGSLAAGIDGFTWGGYARIDALWVEAGLRGQGLGRQLVEAFERAARARGCTSVVLATHEFQAPGFYERLGYELVGETLETPRGYREQLFQKRFDGRE
jgi:GNAT superfamily N-acetyltransferase